MVKHAVLVFIAAGWCAQGYWVRQGTRTQLFKTNDAVSCRIVKTLIITFGIYAHIFAEKKKKKKK